MKYGVGKDQYVAQNVIEAIVLSTFSLFGLKVVEMHVGLNRRSLRRALCQRQLLDAKQEGKYWAKRDKKIKKDVVSKDVKTIVAKWYFEETKLNPNK